MVGGREVRVWMLPWQIILVVLPLWPLIQHLALEPELLVSLPMVLEQGLALLVNCLPDIIAGNLILL